jgi:hypothetical protein
VSNFILYKGETFSSLKKLVESEASEGLSYSIVATRIRDGWDLEMALCKPKNKNSRKTWTIGNKEFKNLKDLAKEAGISYEAAIKRSHRGWSDEEIFYGRKKPIKTKTAKIKKPKGRPIFIDNEEYDNLRHAYDSICPNCTFNALRARLRYGWSLEEALEIKSKIDGRKLTTASKTLIIDEIKLSATQASIKYKTPYSTILDRLNRGATTKQAVGLQNIEKGDLTPQSEAYKTRKRREKKRKEEKRRLI